MRFVITFLILSVFFGNKLYAQSEIKVYDKKINRLDKKNRKQGEWLFFNPEGFAIFSCTYKNDNRISPIVFYENSDTAFVKFEKKDSIQDFIAYYYKKKYYGAYVYTSDSSYRIELEDDNIPPAKLISHIKKYENISCMPLYYFAQQKLIDFTSAGLTGLDVNFNKPVSVILTISGSGIVTGVEFPKNYFSDKEERELYWMYSTMPRWQPYFNNNKTGAIKIKLGVNSSISVFKPD